MRQEIIITMWFPEGLENTPFNIDLATVNKSFIEAFELTNKSFESPQSDDVQIIAIVLKKLGAEVQLSIFIEWLLIHIFQSREALFTKMFLYFAIMLQAFYQAKKVKGWNRVKFPISLNSKRKESKPSRKVESVNKVVLF